MADKIEVAGSAADATVETTDGEDEALKASIEAAERVVAACVAKVARQLEHLAGAEEAHAAAVAALADLKGN